LPAAIPVPPGLLAFADRGEGWTEWLDGLPRLARDIVEDWDLRVDGAPVHGFCALVLPVRTTSGRPAVLKVSWPHDEAEHEHLALQALHGNGMVELYRADPRRHAMLLERLHTEDLGSLDEVEACEVVASFYSRIHVRALPQLRTLTSYVDRWTAALAALPRDAPLPRRLVEQAVSLGRSFVSDSASDGVMIHGDLHYGNVLAADREPWLVIDPKPVSGDPHYEVAPLLWNRWEEVLASGNVRGAVRRRFHAVVDAALLDEDRARDWVVVRMLHNAMWTVTESAGPLTEEDRDWLTECVAIAKAVQG
jgi:streptomycin 6-kinase